MSRPGAEARLEGSVLVRDVRLVPVGSAVPSGEPVDVRVRDGLVTQVGPGLPREAGEQVLEAAGRWGVPGLWDGHVHLLWWAQSRLRLDLSATADPAEVTRLVADHVAGLPAGLRGSVVSGYGYRSAGWARQPTVAELDAVSADHPVVLISGDGHNGWLSSRALQALGVAPRDGALDENEWFEVFTRLGDLPGARADTERAYREAVREAAARGLVGVVDMELAPGYRDWPERVATGVDQLRVRPATYPDRLGEVLAAGLRTGQDLPGGRGLITLGPLKIISDGSLNTRTAWCCEPYADAAALTHPRGRRNYGRDELHDLLRLARGGGLEVAVHAIGDAAVAAALDAFEATGATGSVEHAQLVAVRDLARMARLGVRASVQPAHLLDDRDVTQQCWPDRSDRCFPLRSLQQAGVGLVLGSDAPVSPLDPWLAMAAAVHRSGDGREPWNPAESLTAAEALAASTDGRTTVGPGSRADLALLDDDPLRPFDDPAATAAHLRGTRVAATLVAGRVTHLAL